MNNSWGWWMGLWLRANERWKERETVEGGGAEAGKVEMRVEGGGWRGNMHRWQVMASQRSDLTARLKRGSRPPPHLCSS